MNYRTEGIDASHTTHDTGSYASLEEALLGLARTMKDFNQGNIKEEADKEKPALINMWREPDSPICYTRIHFERIEILLDKRKGVPSLPPSTPSKRLITT